jgi:SAM-dependent methyltransferase
VPEATTNSTAMPRDFYREDCPICGSSNFLYAFINHGYPINQCADCQLLFRNPQPPDDVLDEIYSHEYFLGERTAEGERRVGEMKRATARLYLRQLFEYAGTRPKTLLEIGCGTGDLLVEAQALGVDVVGVDVSSHAAAVANERLGRAAVMAGKLDEVDLPAASFDACVLSDVVEHDREPVQFLRRVRQLLKPGGVLFLATPSVESWSARLLKWHWMEFKLEHLTFFGPGTIENALAKADFDHVRIIPNSKILTPEYIYYHFERFNVPVVSSIVDLAYRALPTPLKRQQLKIVASGIAVMARAAEPHAQPVVSIIVPAYNEQQTFSTLMDQLIAKEIEGMRKEIIIVESNSTDGTREAALRYRDVDGVTLVLQDRPQGKGRAVREGLLHATGDIIMIQDADLEYDLNDYEALLEPIKTYKRAFVLGNRHGNVWKMRQYVDQPVTATFLNAGHVLFTAIMNTLYQKRMNDPFTMFKVFRRDCLSDLTFECNRFDFDVELVSKLIRKGYDPLEIPVNYRSRSFNEGKKISVFRDPWTWLAAMVRYRFKPLSRGRRA